MFLGIFTAGVGIYVLLIAARVLHKGLLKAGEDGPRRMGMIAFGLGMLIVGLYSIHHSYTLLEARKNPSYQAPGRSGVPGRTSRTPLFPPRSAPQNPR